MVISSQRELDEWKAKLSNIIHDLKTRRDAHVIWRDCPDIVRENNPGCGSKEYHGLEVETLDGNIQCLEELVVNLAITPPSADVVLKKFFVNFMENVYPDTLRTRTLEDSRD